MYVRICLTLRKMRTGPSLATPVPDDAPIMPMPMEAAPARPTAPVVTDTAVPQQAAPTAIPQPEAMPHVDYSPWGMYRPRIGW